MTANYVVAIESNVSPRSLTQSVRVPLSRTTVVDPGFAKGADRGERTEREPKREWGRSPLWGSAA